MLCLSWQDSRTDAENVFAGTRLRPRRRPPLLQTFISSAVRLKRMKRPRTLLTVAKQSSVSSIAGGRSPRRARVVDRIAVIEDHALKQADASRISLWISSTRARFWRHWLWCWAEPPTTFIRVATGGLVPFKMMPER